MSEIKKLLTQSSHYLSGQILLMSVGFISFPILTRVFTPDEYGILGLLTTTILIFVSISKLGVHTAIRQFYAEFKSSDRLSIFYSTMFFTSLLSASTISILLFVILLILPTRAIQVSSASFFLIISVIVLTRSINDNFLSFFVAEQKTKIYNLLSVLRRYGQLLLGLFFVFFIITGLTGYFFGIMLAGLMIFSFLLFSIIRYRRVTFNHFSYSLLVTSAKFGLPLVITELGHLLLNYADRYLITVYLGAASLGIYTAAYNLSLYVCDFIKYPLNYALTPIYMDILVNKGEEATKKFFSTIFTIFCFIAAPITFGFIAICDDFTVLLASAKYSRAASIIPYLIFGQVIYSLQIILNSGLFIYRKTYILTLVMLSSLVLNLSLNFLLIPKFGIRGAALATLISFIFYTGIVIFVSFRVFSFSIDWLRVAFYLAASFSMMIILNTFSLSNVFLNISTKIVLGVSCYLTIVGSLDSFVRHGLFGLINSFFRFHKEGTL